VTPLTAHHDEVLRSRRVRRDHRLTDEDPPESAGTDQVSGYLVSGRASQALTGRPELVAGRAASAYSGQASNEVVPLSHGQKMKPRHLRWLFWDADLAGLDVERDAPYVLARVLEHGTLRDVKWALRVYGAERIHRFFREVGHPELSDRTLSFWRAFFKAYEEPWAQPPPWRKTSAVPWPG